MAAKPLPQNAVKAMVANPATIALAELKNGHRNLDMSRMSNTGSSGLANIQKSPLGNLFGGTMIEVQQRIRLKTLKERERDHAAYLKGKKVRRAPFTDPFIRWLARWISGGFIFWLFVVWLLPTRREAIGFLRLCLGPKIGDESILEQTYADNCEITGVWNFAWSKVLGNVFDRFFIAHLVGYLCLSYSVRNTTCVQLVSVGFELMELSLRNWIPNFKECWWDSFFLDLCICNHFGTKWGMIMSSMRLKMHPISCGAIKPLVISERPWVAVLLVTSAILSMLNGFVLKRMLLIQESHFIFPWRSFVTAWELYYVGIEVINDEVKIIPPEQYSSFRKTALDVYSPFQRYIMFPILTASMFQQAFVHFVLEFAVIYKFGIANGHFDFDELPFFGQLYAFSIIVLFFVATYKVTRVDAKEPRERREMVDVTNRRFVDKLEEFQDWLQDQHWARRVIQDQVEEDIMTEMVEEEEECGNPEGILIEKPKLSAKAEKRRLARIEAKKAKQKEKEKAS